MATQDTDLNFPSPVPEPPPSFLRRIWNGITGFIRAIFAGLGRIVVGTFKAGMILLFTGGLSGALIVFGIYYYYNQELPKDLSVVADYRPQSLTQVFSEDGELIGEFFLERRVVMPLDKMSPLVIRAFLAAEDARFYQHQGIDPAGILRAMATNLKAGRVVQGGSTITQQVVKNLLLTPERSLSRKIKEAILSFRIERELTKDQILFTYLNMVYLGHGAYGVEAASQTYYGRSCSELSVAEAALLAGLVKAPTTNSPYLRFERARERQLYVLDQMAKAQFITPEQARRAVDEPLNILSRPEVNNLAAPYFVEHVRRLVMSRYGGNLLYQQGLRIETTVRMDLQRMARLAVRHGVEVMAARQGYQGPDGAIPFDGWEKFRRLTWKEVIDTRIIEGRRLPPEPLVGEVYAAVVLQNDGKRIVLGLGPEEVELEPDDLKIPVPRLSNDDWVMKSVATVLEPGSMVRVRYLAKAEGDKLARVTLKGVPAAQAAMVVMEPKTGFIRAMVGGYDYNQSRYNRATQSRRQPGSSFKPFIYAAALEAGMAQTSQMVDAPVSFRVAGGRYWSPKNYGNRYYGTVTLRTALTKSLNSISVKLLNQVGVDSAVRLAKRMGIRSPLVANLSLALGSSDVSLLEMVTGYAGFAGNGLVVEPISIRRITDGRGRIIEDRQDRTAQNAAGGADITALEAVNEGDEEQELPSRRYRSRYGMSPAAAFVLSDVMKNVIEEGTATRLKVMGRPIAGKTGTTNGYVDAWFIGFTPQLATGVWVGTDSRNPLGKDETGGKAAAPIWLEFMQQALKDEPVLDFEVPPGVVFARVDPRSGQASSGPDARFLPFTVETVPTSVLPRSGTRDPADEL